MFMEVQEAIFKAVQFAKFLVISCEEVTTVDNGFYIFIHAYMVEYSIKVPILLKVE
jgi:hypothetical protein